MSTVGWAAGVDVPVVFHFDLEQEATLRQLRFNTVGGGGSGVVEVGLRVFVSLDDQDYVLAAEHVAPPLPRPGQPTTKGIHVTLSLAGARARYVSIVAMAPAPRYFVFVDEIEIHGQIPADPGSSLPIQPAVSAHGAREIQELLAGAQHATNMMTHLTAPVEQHIKAWPDQQAKAQRKDITDAKQRTTTEAKNYDQIRVQLTSRHRDRAFQVYGTPTLVWEVEPSERFTMLSLSGALDPPQRASVHTAINALEATALGVANLSTTDLPLKVTVVGSQPDEPVVTPRVGRFSATTNGQIVPDVLLATDSPQVIPAGESKLVWIGVESTGSKPDTYTYELTVDIGLYTHRIPLNVYVHNVTLSHETPLITGNWSYLNTGEGPLFPQIRDAMLKHRITAALASAQAFPTKDADGNVIRPLRIDFSDFDKFLAFHKDFDQVAWYYPFNPHVARPHSDWFGPAEWMSDEFKDIFGEWLAKLVARIRLSGRDYDAFYFHMFDETMDEMVAELCELVHAVDPNVRMQATIPQASQGATKRFVEAGMNIYNHHAPSIVYNNAPEGMHVLADGGRELWFYAAAAAAFGVGQETDPLGWTRHLHWTAFYHGATGVHFWNMLHNRPPVWTEKATYFPMVYPNAEGYPAPPSDVQTAEKVIPSRRWEHVRMGIEDYMLLKMAEQRIDMLGSAGAAQKRILDEIVKTVIINRDTNRKLFRQKRRELMELVEGLG